MNRLDESNVLVYKYFIGGCNDPWQRSSENDSFTKEVFEEKYNEMECKWR